MTTKTEKLAFAYLYYTANLNTGEKTLIGVFKTRKAAKSHMDVTYHQYIPVTGPRRILQKLNKENGQYWYIEKHVMMDAR